MTKFRPDISDYLPYVQALADRLNNDALHKISLTDVVKIAIERSMESYCPDVKINRTRRKYERLNF